MPIVTLTTDIGQQDYIVGAIKGQLLSGSGNIVIADISHFLSQSNFPEAAYLCNNAFKYYPAGSIHIVILNFFEKKQDHILLAEYNEQFIICADNGLLTMIGDGKPNKVYKIPCNHKQTFLQMTHNIAVAVAKMSSGQHPQEFIETIDTIETKVPLRPTISDNWIKAHVIFIDNFENVILNITKEVFEEQRRGRRFSIVLKNDTIDDLSNNYMTVQEGEKLVWFNSAGYVELAMNRGNIAGLFGLQGFNEMNYKEGKSMPNKYFYTFVSIIFHD